MGRSIGIAGGGIGGLAAATVLMSRGARVAIYERTRRQHQGIALLIWSNAMRVLAELGVSDKLLVLASPIDRTVVRNASGEVLSELPVGDWSKKAGMPSVAMRRGDLVAALLARVGEGIVREGSEVVSFRHDGEGVSVRLATGDEERLDMLIGADGLHSTVRAQLLGPSPPRALQQSAWVGWARSDPSVIGHGTASATIGHGPRFWMTPLDGGVFWYATINTTSDRREVLAETFAGWHAPIADVIAQTRSEDVIWTQIRDREPSERWGEGAVTLLGDAAHASTPDLGQGACQALESAMALGVCLDRSDSIHDGLRAYERARMERTATISRLCWMTSVNSTIENATLCRVRDAAVKIGLRAVARSHLEWILAGQPC